MVSHTAQTWHLIENTQHFQPANYLLGDYTPLPDITIHCSRALYSATHCLPPEEGDLLKNFPESHSDLLPTPTENLSCYLLMEN